MAAIFFRIFLVYKLLTTILLYLVPKKLRTYLPPSCYPYAQQQQQHQQQQQLTKEPISSSSSSSSLSSPARRMDADELRRVFQTFDRNGDGRITRKELSDSLENMGIFIPEQDLTQMIDRIDANGDGCVDIDEFGVLYRAIMEEREEGEEEEEGDMREAFNVFDRNGDGFITVDELQLVLASLGLRQGKVAGEDCRKMITKVDADGDGRVDFNEFKQMMRGGGFANL